MTQPWPARPTDKRRDHTIYCQYKADWARRTLKGIDEQVAKAERAVAGTTPVKRNQFVKLTGGDRSVNRALEAKARSLAELRGYVTNLNPATAAAGFVIGAYHRLFQAEKFFRMSKTDLRARPIYHHKRESIEAHLTVVLAVLAVSKFIETETVWSIRNSCGPPAATAPSRSKSVSTSSRQPTRYPSILPGRSTPSEPRAVLTN